MARFAMSGDGFVRRETTADGCSRCLAEPRKPGQRWGKICHAAYMRAWRAKRVRSLSDAELRILEEFRASRGARV